MKLEGSQVVEKSKTLRSVRRRGKKVQVRWPWYVRCGRCNNDYSIRIDVGHEGRVSDFKRRKFNKIFKNLYCYIAITAV